MTDILERLKSGHQGFGVGPLDCHDAAGEINMLRAQLASIEACCATTLIGFETELGEGNIAFICDQIARKVRMTGDPRPRKHALSECRLSALVDAMDQLLDDMGIKGQSVCLSAKAQARVAFEPFRDKDKPTDWLMPLEDAERILRERDL